MLLKSEEYLTVNNFQSDIKKRKVVFMKSLCVSLESVDKIKDFVNTMNNIEGAVFLSGGLYTVDEKSIIGIFSLDLSKKLNLEIEDWKEEYIVPLKKYLSEQNKKQ